MEKIIHHVTLDQRKHLLSIIPKYGLPILYSDQEVAAEDSINNYKKWHHLKIDESGVIVGVDAIAYIVAEDLANEWEVVSFEEFCKEIERFKLLDH